MNNTDKAAIKFDKKNSVLALFIIPCSRYNAKKFIYQAIFHLLKINSDYSYAAEPNSSDCFYKSIAG